MADTAPTGVPAQVHAITEQLELVHNQIAQLGEQMEMRALGSALQTLRSDADRAVIEIKQRLSSLEHNAQAAGHGDGGGQGGYGFLNLIDSRSMVPPTFSGSKGGITFKEWSRKVNSYLNAKSHGYWKAMEWCELEEGTLDDDAVQRSA